MMTHTVTGPPRWPEHLLQHCRLLSPSADTRAPAPADARREVWVGLQDALGRYLRFEARRFRGIQPQDLEDMGSAKALELLSRIESGEWSLAGRSPGELASYIGTVARNALVSAARSQKRWTLLTDSCDVRQSDNHVSTSAKATSPDAETRAGEFIESLKECIGRLQPRARLVWYFRAFHEMTSASISRHHRVALNPGHVDVIIQRARDAIRGCMNGKGLDPTDMSTGTFIGLWEFLECQHADIESEVEVS